MDLAMTESWLCYLRAFGPDRMVWLCSPSNASEKLRTPLFRPTGTVRRLLFDDAAVAQDTPRLAWLDELGNLPSCFARPQRIGKQNTAQAHHVRRTFPQHSFGSSGRLQPSCGSGHLGLLRVQVHHIENR
jgi:hypothetical protein